MFKKFPALYTDLYELTMAQGYFLSNRKEETAVFDYFFRKLPFNSGYAVFAGLGSFIDILKELSFSEDEIHYLRSLGFKESFLDYLKTFEFRGSIKSVQEGEIVFNNTPLVQVEGSVIEAQIIETVLLNTLNFETLIATKAKRIRHAAHNKVVLDFGLRRSQGLGGVQASKASIIGGLNGTSNVYAGFEFGLNVSGTMAHSWIQSFDDEYTAFKTYAEHYPEQTVLLVDTYDTIAQGVPNAIKIATLLRDQGSSLKAVRLDSGDLAYLSKKTRYLLDEAGFGDVKIAVSNQLDEYLIKSLLEQEAPIDIFGVGTKLVTAYDHPALDGVYKLAEINGKPTLKISENIEKITLPGKKAVTRYLNSDQTFYADGISLDSENQFKEIKHPHFPAKRISIKNLDSESLLHTVVENGKIVLSDRSVNDSSSYCSNRFVQLSEEYKRFDNPHIYKVGISEGLMTMRDEIINSYSE